MKHVIIILFLVALLFIPLYWISGKPILGMVGFASLCLGNISLIADAVLRKKGGQGDGSVVPTGKS